MDSQDILMNEMEKCRQEPWEPEFSVTWRALINAQCLVLKTLSNISQIECQCSNSCGCD